jgi:hypothetical protein
MPPVKFVLRAFSWSSTHQLSDLVPEPCNVVSEFSGVYTRNVNKIVCRSVQNRVSFNRFRFVDLSLVFREIITSPAAATFSLGCSVDCASSGLILSVSDLDTGDVVVANSTAFGSVFVPHLFLNANQNVLVECRLDPLCVGDWNQNQPASSDENAKPALSWTITLQASVAGLTVSKDFRQIDMFGAIKAEWETSNPGRAEKAKAARAKYLNPPAVDPALEFTINNNTGEQPTQPVVKTAKAPVEVGLNAPVAQLTAELSQQRADALKERAEQSNQEKERAAQRRQAELEYRLDAVAKQWISDAQVHFFLSCSFSVLHWF